MNCVQVEIQVDSQIMEKIKNIENLLAQFVKPYEKVISITMDRLTPPGENYLSLVLKLDVVLLNEETGIQNIFSGVAKCFNPHEENDKELKEFETGNYISELTFYKEIIPILQDFTQKRGLNFDIFPKLVAYRSNLHGKNDDVDQDGVIVLENMKIQGKVKKLNVSVIFFSCILFYYDTLIGELQNRFLFSILQLISCLSCEM